MNIYDFGGRRVDFSEIDGRFYLNKWDDVKKEWLLLDDKHLSNFVQDWIEQIELNKPEVLKVDE